MNKVRNYQEVLDAIKEVKEVRKGILTNFFPDVEKITRWINSGTFFISKIKDSLFLFRYQDDIVNFFFFTTTPEMLSLALAELTPQMKETLLVTDLLGKPNDVSLLEEVFRTNKFFPYVTLCRMNKSSQDILISDNHESLKVAGRQHADSIFHLLNTYFDPVAEQLPSQEEILAWIDQGNISIFEENKEILGFVIYNLIGLTSYLRYWFVHPQHRDKKIGSVLLNKFFSASKEAKRQLFWVIQSNDNAIKRYKHYGCEPENLVDSVMTNKNIHYEAKGD